MPRDERKDGKRKSVCRKHGVEKKMAYSYFPVKRGSLICPQCTKELLKQGLRHG